MTATTPRTEPAAKPPLIWTNVLMFSLTLLVAITAVPWYGIEYGYSAGAWVFFFVFLFACGFSITGGYHRLWAHRTYEAHWALRLFYMIFGAMSLQNSAFIWCSGHRVHHLSVDDVERDPYSAKRGLWFSHIGWMIRRYSSGEPNLTNIPDLKRDPMLAFQHRFYVPLVLVTNFGFPLLAGWLVGDVIGTFLLAGVLRLVISHHVTFFINSLAHYWGRQPYTEENTARDNAFLAFITYGEGYHNFHHIFTHDYRNGVRWWQWDPTKWIIAGLQHVGLTGKLKRVPDFQIQRALLQMQFVRAQRRLEQLPRGRGLAGSAASGALAHIESLRHRVAQEYEAFVAAVQDWTRLKEQWYSDKKREVMERWEHASFHAQLREIERRLREQRRRMRLLQAQLA